MSIFKKIYKTIVNYPKVRRFNQLKQFCEETPDSYDAFEEYNELAECYAKGIGTRRNYKEALRCYIVAAEWGNGKMAYDLAMRYLKGTKVVGGKVNKEEAIKWFKMASAENYKAANLRLKELGVAIETAESERKEDTLQKKEQSDKNLTSKIVEFDNVDLSEKFAECIEGEEYISLAIYAEKTGQQEKFWGLMEEIVDDARGDSYMEVVDDIYKSNECPQFLKDKIIEYLDEDISLILSYENSSLEDVPRYIDWKDDAPHIWKDLDDYNRNTIIMIEIYHLLNDYEETDPRAAFELYYSDDYTQDIGDTEFIIEQFVNECSDEEVWEFVKEFDPECKNFFGRWVTNCDKEEE